jgi:allene oxide cyclase
MRSRVLWIVVVAVAATISVAVVASAGASRSEMRYPVKVSLVEHAISDQEIDVGDTGFSNGDLLTFANPIFNASNAQRVGRDQGSCIVVNATKVHYQCSWTTWFDDGSLTVEGPFFGDRETNLAITGGTGDFSTARGWMHLGFRADPAEFDFVFFIQR